MVTKHKMTMTYSSLVKIIVSTLNQTIPTIKKKQKVGQILFPIFF